jgi:isopentenyl-diphosphate delta-isomerase
VAESISDRKRSHLELCEGSEVEYARKTTLFEEVDLVHNALPELAVDEVDVSTTLLGKRLRAPLLISGMTGGTEEASEINHGLARGLGSQRAMHRQPHLAHTFSVRAEAPAALVLANLGLVQAADMLVADVERLIASVGADAVCIHLNPAQEMIQPGGDRDFRRGYTTLTRLVRELPVPVVVKETGCGLSRAVGERLRAAGIRTVDVSGAGGTSWVKVEALRADAGARALGEEFGDWGIPTAASLLGLRGLGFEVIASGGIRSGLEVAKAIALGARAAGVALPAFRAYREGGEAAAGALVERLVAGLRLAMVLTGSRDVASLGKVPVVIGSRLRDWVVSGGGA